MSLTNPRLEVETVGLMDLAVETAGLDEADLQPVSGLAESGEHGIVALCERNVTFASFLVSLQSAPSTDGRWGDEGQPRARRMIITIDCRPWRLSWWNIRWRLLPLTFFLRRLQQRLQPIQFRWFC